MIIEENICGIRKIVKEWHRQGLSVGFVPTMGYLHDGHKSLIDKSVAENDRTVVSIFVNPTQFAPNEDFSQYPRDFKKDSQLCSSAGVDLIFNPQISEMYPDNFYTNVRVDRISKLLCGKSRPKHFKGVCTVVTKLFNIVTPDNAYFGEKDAQQLAIIKKMVRDLNMDINIIGCPIVRDSDGLAKSSRNTYLSPEERKAALVINHALKKAKQKLDEGERSTFKIIDGIRQEINCEPLARIDYVEICDCVELNTIVNIDKDILVAVAVYIGKTRLIDNFTYKIKF